MALGVEPGPAADAQLDSDLLAETGPRARVPSQETILDTVESAFGRRFFDERARSGVEAARERAHRLSAAAGSASTATALAYAADVFVSLAVERSWRARDVGTVLEGLGRALGCSNEQSAVDLLVTALRAPQLGELPPQVALEVQLSMLVALTPAVEASLWVRDPGGRPDCLMSVGGTAKTRRFRSVAARILDGDSGSDDPATILGTPVRRWQAPWGALVARVRTRELIENVFEEVAAAIGVVLERDHLLQRSAARERSLVSATERRLSRLGFDLHDGALQQVAVLDADLRRLREGAPTQLASGVEAVSERLAELDGTLRELAHSLEPASLLRRPLERVLETEAAALSSRTGINIHTRLTGQFSTMTASQKIAMIRVVQEAFANIREHSAAENVELSVTESRSCVELVITDDGVGFEVTRTLQDAAQRGRLGLVGSSERLRLLGGTFDLRSRPGGPTTLSVTLPRWQPVAAEDESPRQLAY